MINAPRSNAFHADSSSSVFDDKLRLALSRGLAQAYGGVLREPIPERLQALIRTLQEREARAR